MYVCMHVWMYACLYVRICVSVCVCMYPVYQRMSVCAAVEAAPADAADAAVVAVSATNAAAAAVVGPGHPSLSQRVAKELHSMMFGVDEFFGSPV